MFEQFVKTAASLERYRRGPYAEERKRFLAFLKELGYGYGRMEVINRFLLSVAQRINLDDGATFSRDDLLGIAETWSGERSQRWPSAKTRHVYKVDFVFVATRWMEFLDRLTAAGQSQPFASELESYLRYLQLERGFAEVTVDNRRKSLTLFFNWLSDRSLSLPQVGAEEISYYQKLCAEQGWKRTTISFHVQSLRSFFRYAGSQRWCSDISSIIAAPRLYTHEGLPQGPSWNDVRKLIASESGDSKVQIRNRALLLLFAVYGFRVGEVRGMLLDDLDWRKERIFVRRPKLRKTQEYPLTREVGEAIVRYLKEARPESHHRELFLSLRQPYRPLSRGGLCTVVQQRMRRHGFQSSAFGPHSLRHACATHLLSQGFTLKQIGGHLGHVSEAATRLYAKVDIPGLRQVASLDMAELTRFVEQAEDAQTPIIPRGDLAGLREVADLCLGAVI